MHGFIQLYDYAGYGNICQIWQRQLEHCTTDKDKKSSNILEVRGVNIRITSCVL